MQAGENEFLPLLCVDDNANDRALVRQAIFLSGTHFTFYEADGMESAIPYFQSSSESKQRPRPVLVLLDYELAGHTGADFLYWLRLMKKMSSIPVIMFSGSVGRRHVAECYSMGANHFISKAKDLTRLKIIVRSLHQSILAGHQHDPDPIKLLREYQPDPRIIPVKH